MCVCVCSNRLACALDYLQKCVSVCVCACEKIELYVFSRRPDFAFHNCKHVFGVCVCPNWPACVVHGHQKEAFKVCVFRLVFMCGVLNRPTMSFQHHQKGDLDRILRVHAYVTYALRRCLVSLFIESLNVLKRACFVVRDAICMQIVCCVRVFKWACMCISASLENR
jgi:hypothetical protein